MIIDDRDPIECRNTAQIFMTDGSPWIDMSDDRLSRRINFKEMSVGFVQVILNQAEQPDADDFTFRLFVSNVKDPDSFVPYGPAVKVDDDCFGVGWNLGVIGFLYARVLMKKGTVTSGEFKIIARSKRG